MKGKLRCTAVALCIAAMPSLAVAQVYDNGSASAQQYRRRWGISASAGTLTQQEDGGNADSRENEGNAFALTADYYLSRHFALTAGVFAEQTGMLTDYDGDGIGKRRFWMAGLQAGAKYYFLPASWVVQPYLGASAYFNVLNLGHSRGSYDFEANEYQSPRVHAEYSVQCPAVSLVPQVGVDLRLLSSVSLTFAADYRWGLYGKSSTALRYVSGPDMGRRMLLSNPMDRITLSLGLKVDFPLRPVNVRKVGTTVLDLLYIWINGRN